jgi:G:T-mismatch repair DNA endonuclease (very short patch repair protein)
MYNTTFTKDQMIELYDKLGWSLPDFKREIGLSYTQTNFLLKFFKIPSRDIKTANSSSNRANKYKDTCQRKYGVSNVSKLDYIKDSKRKTFTEHYGVDNIWKSKEFKEWYVTYMKTTYGKGSLPNTYGNMSKYWNSKDIDFRRNATIKMREGYKIWLKSLTPEQLFIHNQKKATTIVGIRSSKLELTIAEQLTLLDIPYKHQKWIAGRSYDFLIMGTNLIIEVNGDYWHANPTHYKFDDIINYPNRKITAQERWNEDFDKVKLAEKYGYKVITLWESDIKNNQDSLDNLIISAITLA